MESSVGGALGVAGGRPGKPGGTADLAEDGPWCRELGRVTPGRGHFREKHLKAPASAMLYHVMDHTWSQGSLMTSGTTIGTPDLPLQRGRLWDGEKYRTPLTVREQSF